MTNWLWLNASGEKDGLRSLEEVTKVHTVQLGQQLLVLLPQTRTLNGRSSMLLCEHNPGCGALHKLAFCATSNPKGAPLSG
jgi:hypothetical protein